MTEYRDTNHVVTHRVEWWSLVVALFIGIMIGSAAVGAASVSSINEMMRTTDACTTNLESSERARAQLEYSAARYVDSKSCVESLQEAVDNLQLCADQLLNARMARCATPLTHAGSGGILRPPAPPATETGRAPAPAPSAPAAPGVPPSRR